MLSKRMLFNFLLIVLIVIFTYIGNRYEVQTGYQSKNSISHLKPEDIQTVTIQTADNNFVLRRTGSQWHFDKPLRWPADSITLERLISIVNNETESRISAAEIDLATLGLQVPKAILTVNDTPILFGATNNIGERRYIMIGSTVYLLPDLHLHFLTQGITGLIDRRLLPRAIPLQSLRLKELSLTKNSAGSWQDTTRGEVAVEPLNMLVNSWQTLNAGSIKIYDKSRIPLQKLIAGLDDGSEIEFYLMSIKPELVIARPDLGLQYHFAEKQYYELLSIAE
jgi:hypothetical protein